MEAMKIKEKQEKEREGKDKRRINGGRKESRKR